MVQGVMGLLMNRSDGEYLQSLLDIADRGRTVEISLTRRGAEVSLTTETDSRPYTDFVTGKSKIFAYAAFQAINNLEEFLRD